VNKEKGTLECSESWGQNQGYAESAKQIFKQDVSLGGVLSNLEGL
jgi:hypothetical protein